jgi:hypothetical protein
MTYPSDLYEVRLYDEDSNFVTILQGWSVLEYWQRLNAPWNHTIRYDLSYDDPRLDTLRSIGPDWFYLIYRTDPVTLDKDKVWEGFHQTTVDQARENGDIIITLYGQGYTEWLNRRVIIPPVADWEVHEVTAAAGTAIKEYVAFNMLTGSVPDADRAMPGFAVAAGPDGGTTVTYSPRYTNLLTACQTLAEDGNVKFGIIGTDDPPLTFAMYTREIWGLDRRINSTKPDKGDPMLFDFMKKNMDIPILSKNYSEQRTVVYVAGTGVGIKRKLLELSNLTALAESPRIRKESYIDSRGAESNAEMLTVGRSYLEKNAAKKSVTFNLRQNESTRWMRDFNLGDIVTAKYFDHLESKEINEIHVTVNTSRDTTFIERIDVEMEGLSDAMVEYLAEWTIDYEDPYPFIPVPDWPPGPEPDPIDLAYTLTTTSFRVTNDFYNTPPNWAEIWTPPAGTFRAFLLDLYDPKEKAIVITADTTANETYIYELTNLASGVPTPTLKQTLAYAAASVQLRNTVQWADTWFLACRVPNVKNVHVYHTHDRWDNMTTTLNAGRCEGNPGVVFAVSSNATDQDNGNVYVGYRASNGTSYLRRSTDMGHSFSNFYQFGGGTYPNALWVPWLENTNDQYIYAVWNGQLYVSSNSGATFGNKTPSGETVGHSFDLQQYNPISYTLSPAGLYLHTSTSTTVTIWRTLNAGESWTQMGTYKIGADNYQVNFGGWPFTPFDTLFMTTKNQIGMSTDGGATWTNKQWAGFDNGIWTIPVWID